METTFIECSTCARFIYDWGMGYLDREVVLLPCSLCYGTGKIRTGGTMTGPVSSPKVITEHVTEERVRWLEID